MTLRFESIHSIHSISCAEWNALAGTGYPFMRHEFLAALETSGAVGDESGWQIRHLLIYRRDNNHKEKLIGAMPLYRKHHSWGEYVFDWAWAQAYERQGLPYYPKLVGAIPYTPSEGMRIALDANESLDNIWPELEKQLLGCVNNERCSSLHLLFTDLNVNSVIEKNSQSTELLARRGVQYHWFNRHAVDENQHPYKHFPDFLADFNSRKRRSLNKERKRVIEQGITLKRLTGTAITEKYWDAFYHCYQLTYLKRSGHGGYLNREFFRQLAETLSEQVLLVVAERDNTFVAAALCFIGSDTLYGRYWGCLEEVDGLHFEACYYQGIEFCIEKQLRRFDPGAQGEHKIARGFRPVFTHSWHFLANPRFHYAIKDFLAREQVHIETYRQEAEQLLPFRHDEADATCDNADQG